MPTIVELLWTCGSCEATIGAKHEGFSQRGGVRADASASGRGCRLCHVGHSACHGRFCVRGRERSSSSANVGAPAPAPTRIGPPAPSAKPSPEEPSASVVRIVPTSGPSGSFVTITGTYFVGMREVCFGTSPSPHFQVNTSGSRITVVVPAGSGTVQVTVVTNFGVSAVRASGDMFTYSGSAIAGGVAPATSYASPCAAASPELSP